ncbi:hypothetical protein [Massilia niastensis]|uniref:hypothetical protein n=1 Tax=Massilia niastensis TaxID=544911 RepID=UPI000368C94E|nr:hypothetical protein [Massilia niastensis]
MGLLDFLFNRPPSREKFGALMARFAAENGVTEPIRFDAAGFRLLIGADGHSVVNLDNFYHAYCTTPRAGRVQLMEKWIEVFTPPAMPPDFATAGKRLMPILRGRGLLEYMRLGQLDVEGHKVVTLPFSSDTSLMLAYDGKDALQTISQDELARWGVDVDTAMAAAMDNLRDATVDRFEQIVPGVFHGTWNDAFDSSRLLLPDLAHRVAGARPVAMVPTRGSLLLASGADTGAVLRMLELADQCADVEPRYVSALLYRFEDGRVVDTLPEDAAVRQRLARLHRRFLASDYGMQKEMLDERHEQDGADLHVARYKVMRVDETGEEFSITTWTQGVAALLPQAERVSLIVLDGTGKLKAHRIVGWDALLDSSHGLLAQVPDAYPPLYRTSRFPDFDTLPGAAASPS